MNGSTAKRTARESFSQHKATGGASPQKGENKMVEIARVKHNNTNRMAIAKAFAKHPTFHLYRISEILSTMRTYEREGLLVITETEAIMYHIYD